MRYVIFYLFVLLSDLCAHSLHEILESQKLDYTTKSLEANRASKLASYEQITLYETPRLGVSIADAKEEDKEGEEHSVSFSQNLALPFASQTKERLKKNLSAAQSNATAFEIRQRALQTASLYYQSCSDYALLSSSQQIVLEYKRSVERLRSAYELGEISKKDLLFVLLEEAQWHKERRAYKRSYLQGVSQLQRYVPQLRLTHLACDDLREPVEKLELNSPQNHAGLEQIAYEQNAAAAQSSLADEYFQDLGYELSYEDELFTKRYKLGISVPLTMLGDMQERKKEESLEKKLSLSYKQAAFSEELNATSQAKISSLRALYEEYLLYDDEILPLSSELHGLLEFAYEEGEASIMELLESSRAFAKSKIEHQEIKKRYYKELFELYKITDTKFGE